MLPPSLAGRGRGWAPQAAGIAPDEPTSVTIDHLAADGDGQANLDGTRLYLPFTLPGERVQPGPLTRRGDAATAEATILDPSPDRVVPPCRHFGPCGGCALQHMADAPYAAWKTSLLADAVARLGFHAAMPPLARTPPHARRRIDLAVARDGANIRLGLHARRSTTIVDMHECTILHPALFAVVQALRPILRSLSCLKREGSALLNLVDTGPDLLLRTDAPLTAPDRTRLAAFASEHGLPRISWAQGPHATPEPACAIRPAILAFAGHNTAIPPGAFLQASREGEHAIQQATLAALPKLKARALILELFAGVGTLTHALATRARVHAIEGDAAALAALRGVHNPHITATHRDLARQPLQPVELKSAAAVVLDPPWSGAPQQMPALAASNLPIVYVTCNPAALLRDGRVLVAAGYRVTSATPVDQFLWSARIEGVVSFQR